MWCVWRKNDTRWRCRCVFVEDFWIWLMTVSNSTLKWTWLSDQQKIISEQFFSFFFAFCRIAKWYGDRISGIVVQFLLWSSFCKLFSQKFDNLRIKIMRWWFGRLAQWFQLVLFTIYFPIQLAHRYYGFETHWLSGLFYFNVNLFYFVSFSCQVVKILLFHAEWSLWCLGNIYLPSEWMYNEWKVVVEVSLSTSWCVWYFCWLTCL